MAASPCEVDVWLVEAKRMRDVSALGNHGGYVGEEAAARPVADAPEHRHKLDIGLREIDVFGGWREAVVEIPG